MYIYIYIYVYMRICIDRDRERERDIIHTFDMFIHTYNLHPLIRNPT